MKLNVLTALALIAGLTQSAMARNPSYKVNKFLEDQGFTLQPNNIAAPAAVPVNNPAAKNDSATQAYHCSKYAANETPRDAEIKQAVDGLKAAGYRVLHVAPIWTDTGRHIGGEYSCLIQYVRPLGQCSYEKH